MLDPRRNGCYIGLDNRTLAVDSRRVDEAMGDHTGYIMDICAIWGRAGAGNKKSHERATQYNKKLHREGHHQNTNSKTQEGRGGTGVYKMASEKGYKLNSPS